VGDKISLPIQRLANSRSHPNRELREFLPIRHPKRTASSPHRSALSKSVKYDPINGAILPRDLAFSEADRRQARSANPSHNRLSDQTLYGFDISDHDRALAEVDQSLSMPSLQLLVDAFPTARRHVAELAL
jgi:hypothetical protein